MAVDNCDMAATKYLSLLLVAVFGKYSTTKYSVVVTSMMIFFHFSVSLLNAISPAKAPSAMLSSLASTLLSSFGLQGKILNLFASPAGTFTKAMSPLTVIFHPTAPSHFVFFSSKYQYAVSEGSVGSGSSPLPPSPPEVEEIFVIVIAPSPEVEVSVKIAESPFAGSPTKVGLAIHLLPSLDA